MKCKHCVKYVTREQAVSSNEVEFKRCILSAAVHTLDMQSDQRTTIATRMCQISHIAHCSALVCGGRFSYRVDIVLGLPHL